MNLQEFALEEGYNFSKQMRSRRSWRRSSDVIITKTSSQQQLGKLRFMIEIKPIIVFEILKVC